MKHKKYDDSQGGERSTGRNHFPEGSWDLSAGAHNLLGSRPDLDLCWEHLAPAEGDEGLRAFALGN